MNRTLIVAAAAVCLMLAACTGPAGGRSASQPGTATTVPGATVTAAANTVHVSLTVTSDHPVTIRYSDGVTTRETSMDAAGASEDESDTKVITFDAPEPYLAAATMTSKWDGVLSCELTVEGTLADTSDTTDGADGTFAMCSAVQDQTANYPANGSHKVDLGATSSAWTAWVAADKSGSGLGADSGLEENPDATGNILTLNEDPGLIRMLVVNTLGVEDETCQITVDRIPKALAKAVHLGDIATCVANVS